jgi:C4-dicarboxylate-specific signal transduction histidine kinase
MSDAKEELLREKGFGFFGAITASLSHELNNVFAIINELSGLLDDFLDAAEQGAPLNVARLKQTTQRVAAQVERGHGHIKRLNGFAHTVDDRRATIVLNEAVEAITALCRRFAVLRQVEIETNLPAASPKITGSAFDLQHIMFRCIDIVLDASKQGDVVQIDVEPLGDGARLICANRSAVESVAELEAKRDVLAVLATDMNSVVESVIQAGQPVWLAVSFPRCHSSRGEDHER